MRKISWTLARWAYKAGTPNGLVEWLMPRFTAAEVADIHARAHAQWLAFQQGLAPEDRDPATTPYTEQETTK